jgi:hypothetical protein
MLIAAIKRFRRFRVQKVQGFIGSKDVRGTLNL